MEELLKFFPEEIKIALRKSNLNNVEEIRIRANKPIILKQENEEYVIQIIITPEMILQIMQKICDNSIYTYQNQICEGFITLKGGHRVGITGNAVMNDGKVSNLNYMSSLNFRIARQIFNCSNQILPFILDTKENQIFNTLIISPPGIGKTTVLRDLIRKISNGIPEMSFKGITVGVVDERGELSATDKGVAQNDLGIRTDIINNIPKAIGMKMLIRSMAPKVIVADEIGSKEDIEAIEYAITSGVKGIFTAHGASLEEIRQNPILNKLILENRIDRIILLDKMRKAHLIYEKNINLYVKTKEEESNYVCF